MGWFRKIQAFVTFHVIAVLLAILFLIFSGKLTKEQLFLAWKVIRHGESAAFEKKDTESEEPKVVASFQAQLDLRVEKLSEIKQRMQELRRVESLVDVKRAGLEDTRKSLLAVRKQVEAGLDVEIVEVNQKSRQIVKDLLEVMQPKLAKNFLMDLEEEIAAIGYIKALDPIAAVKIFKEFKQPAENKKLNQWLEKLGQGEPEKTKGEQLKKEIPPVQ